MPVPTDITAGTLTITNGSTAVTGTGTAWLASDLRQGDIILWIEGGDGFQTPILADVPASNTALTIVEPWEGPTLTGVRYRIRYQWDSSRVSAQSRQLIEMLDNGNVLALSGLTGPGVPVFDGPHSMVVRPEQDFINGVAYDVQVDTLADRAAYDGQAEGFAVLVSDVGDGRSALYSKNSNTSGDWSDPAYITGDIGNPPNLTAGTATTLPPEDPFSFSLTPVGDGEYEINLSVPQGQASTVPGPKGDGLQIDAIDTLANRSLYDGEVEGFTFLSTDGILYIKNSNASGDWSSGSAISTGSISLTVTNRTALKAFDTSVNQAVYLTESGREGWFIWQPGNFTAEIGADTQEGLYIKANAIAASAGAWVRDFTGPISDRWFGVVADTVLSSSYSLISGQDDTAAIQAFAAYIRFMGGGHFVLDGGVRRVWSSAVSHGSILLDIAGTTGTTIEYRNGAQIHAMHPNSTTETGTPLYGIIWHFTHADQVRFINPRLSQEGYKTPVFDAGVVHFDWGWNQTSGGRLFTSAVFENVWQIGGIGGLIVRDITGAPTSDVVCTGGLLTGFFQDVYYPVNLQGNGDNSSFRYRTLRCGRSLFAYNVSNVRGDIIVDTPSLTSGAVNLTCYDDPNMRNQVSDITLSVKVRGTWFGDPASAVTGNTILFPINLIHVAGGTGGSKVRNIRYSLDVLMSGATPVAGGKVIAINKYDNTSGSAADATARGHQISGVSWRGAVEGNFTGPVSPFALFTDNPLGTENWTGEQVSDVGFDHLYAQGAEMDINIDGTGINRSVGVFYIRDCFFGGSSHTFSNMLGKWQYQNSYLLGLNFAYTVAWTADTTPPSLGNGVMNAEYEIDGDYCIARLQIFMGSTTTYGSGNWRFSLPIPPVPSSVLRISGGARAFESTVTTRTGVSVIVGGESFMRGLVTNTPNYFNAGVPSAWKAGDNLNLEIRYRWK